MTLWSASQGPFSVLSDETSRGRGAAEERDIKKAFFFRSYLLFFFAPLEAFLQNVPHRRVRQLKIKRFGLVRSLLGLFLRKQES